MKITLLMLTLIFLRQDVFNNTPPYCHGIDFQFSVKDVVPQNSHHVCPVGHYRRHFNVTLI